MQLRAQLCQRLLRIPMHMRHSCSRQLLQAEEGLPLRITLVGAVLIGAAP